MEGEGVFVPGVCLCGLVGDFIERGDTVFRFFAQDAEGVFPEYFARIFLCGERESSRGKTGKTNGDEIFHSKKID